MGFFSTAPTIKKVARRPSLHFRILSVFSHIITLHEITPQEEDPMEKDLLSHHSVTLNSLLAEQQALNMRMLLAVQLRDTETQEALRRELEEIALKIEQFLEGRL